MAQGKYEGSRADKANDKREAKKSGMSMKAWEKSPADKKMDKAGQKALDAKKRKKK